MDYDEKKKIRRSCRKRMVKFTTQVQTVLVIYELECGHRASFTVSGQKFTAGRWKEGRKECWQCAEKIIREREQAE